MKGGRRYEIDSRSTGYSGSNRGGAVSWYRGGSGRSRGSGVVVWSALLVDTLILITYTYTLEILYYSHNTYSPLLYISYLFYLFRTLQTLSAEKQRINSWAGPWFHTFSLLFRFSFLLHSLSSPLHLSLSLPPLFDLHPYLPIIHIPLNFYLPTYGTLFPIWQHQLRYSDNFISTTNLFLDIVTTRRASTARTFFRIVCWTMQGGCRKISWDTGIVVHFI